jgi:hypothetical protein
MLDDLPAILEAMRDAALHGYERSVIAGCVALERAATKFPSLSRDEAQSNCWLHFQKPEKELL